MQDYFKRFLVLRSSEVIFSFLIKLSTLKAIEIETAFFSFSWKSQGWHVGLFPFMLYIPLQIDTYIVELVEIFLKLSMKTVQVHLIIGTTLIF